MTPLRRAIQATAMLTAAALLPLHAAAEELLPGGAADFSGSQDSQSAARSTMVQRIDQLLAAPWAAEGIEPAAVADDAEFLRRVCLDLTGVIPPVAQARAFLADPAPDKRSRLVDQLLNSPGYATHMATVWRNRLLPRGIETAQVQSAIGLEDWLRRQFLENLRYDNLVADFLVAEGDGQSGPALYYTSLELKPEKLASSSARLFLGLQIQCAECHDHPFDRWTQRDFWGYAAYFAQLEPPRDERPDLVRVMDRMDGEVVLPGSDERILPRFPGAAQQPSDGLGTRRSQLAIWMASRDNPYLARAAVNAAWAQLFGRGLVHPIDDHSAQNPPSHPELLDELARYFVDSGFDLQELFRTLASTTAYQRTSVWVGEPPAEHLFARMLPKTLTPEQLYNCVERAAAFPVRQLPAGQATNNPLADPQRLDFLLRMQSPARDALDYQAGLPQALVLMNGPHLSAATDPETSPLLRALEAPFFTDSQRLELLLLATLTRFPTTDEQQVLLQHVSENGPPAAARQAWSDVAWALLNSAEFATNH